MLIVLGILLLSAQFGQALCPPGTPTPNIFVTKVVVGGDWPANQFIIGVDDPGTDDDPKNASATGVCYEFSQGNYAITEALNTTCVAYAPNQGNDEPKVCLDVICVSGYLPSFSADCRGKGDGPSGNGNNNGNGNSAGSSLACTVTNTYLGPLADTALTVVKNVINNNGGTLQPLDFTIHVTHPCGNVAFQGDAAGVVVPLRPGLAYTVTETLVTGYTPTYSAGCRGTLAVGEKRFCTITNDDIDMQVGTE